MPNQTYHIPVIPSDLRQEETIKQICDSLEYLEKVADDIFKRIGQKVAANQDQAKKINARVDLAQAKIDKIKGSNKATKVFSGSKYPAPDLPEEYTSLYRSPNDLGGFKHSRYHLQGRHPAVDDRVLKEKRQYYNVQIKKKGNDDGSQGEGLGRLPSNINSISSLLLFNTSENPYKKYVIMDPLGVVTKTRQIAEEAEDGLADAPSTITHREELQRMTRENVFYVPTAGQVPEIAVPDFLPELPGVADDLSYMAEIGHSIAPSVPGSNMPDLPSVVPEIPAGPASALPSIGNDDTPVGAPPPPPPPPPPDAAPPPPPPPPPPPDSAPPPPPPPPPPVPSPSDADSTPSKPKGATSKAPAEVAQPDQGRASLLESIRAAGGAGGAKLKNTKARKIEVKKKIQEEKNTGGAAGTGDLMGDLSAKLRMRRLGIQGNKAGGGGGQDEAGGPTNAMDRISAMIPPPPSQGNNADTVADDGDWD